MTQAPPAVIYLINSYPLPSQTFIRREIQALERQGFAVCRIAMRASSTPLTDEGDLAEAAVTEHLLSKGLMRLALSALQMGVRRPQAALRALGQAWRYGARGAGGAVPGTGGRMRHLVYWIEALAVAQRARARQIGHIHAHFATNSATIAQLAATVAGTGFSFTLHGPEEFDAVQALSLPQKLARARFCVAITSYAKAQLCRWSAPENWSRIKVVHCGIEPWKFPAPDAPPLRAAGQLELVAIGRLAEQKGFALLLEAVDLARAHLPQLRVRLLGDGPYRADLAAAINARGLGAHLQLMGWQDEAGVRAALAQCDALVLPSFAEGLPMVVMEAFAAARPVLASAIAGLPELVTPETGILFPAGDSVRLAEAICAFAALAPAARAQMGAAARARVLARHDIDIEAAKLAAHFRAALSARG